jgi:predicted O-methyltransferase YrrM
MQGSVPRKIGRVIGDLVVHPQYIPGYAATNLFSEQTPLEQELPWFSYRAIDFLASFLQPEMSVFEYGSGGSTLFFARAAGSVVSTENDARWLEKVDQRLRAKRIGNVILQHREFDVAAPEDFEQSSYLHSIPAGNFDVIVVDGAEERVPVRPMCFYHAENYVQAGGIIVVDDSWKYPQLRQKNRAKRHQIFKSVGPCRPGVTSTDVFFY